MKNILTYLEEQPNPNHLKDAFGRIEWKRSKNIY